MPPISPAIHHPFGQPIVGGLANDRTCFFKDRDTVQRFNTTMKRRVRGLGARVGVQQGHEAR